MANHTNDWSELAISLYDKLSGRNSEITYEAENVEVWVPSGVGEGANHALWKVNGSLKIRARDGAKPDASLPIGVHGDLRLDSPSGRRLVLTAEGSQLHLAVPRWAELQGLGPRSLLAQRRALVATIRALRKVSLTLSIDVAGQRVLGLGASARTTMLARLLGLTSADIRWPTVINLLRARAAAA